MLPTEAAKHRESQCEIGAADDRKGNHWPKRLAATRAQTCARLSAREFPGNEDERQGERGLFAQSRQPVRGERCDQKLLVPFGAITDVPNQTRHIEQSCQWIRNAADPRN